MFREFINNRTIGFNSIRVVDLKCRNRGPSFPIVIPTYDGLIAATPRRKRSRVLKVAENSPPSLLPSVKRSIIVD
jgi:hypothetical protein